MDNLGSDLFLLDMLPALGYLLAGAPPGISSSRASRA